MSAPPPGGTAERGAPVAVIPRLLKVLALGCAVVVLLTVGLAVACYRWLAHDPEGVRVAVEAPLEVRAGERFTLVARVANAGSEPRRLVSIDVSESYLRGLAVESTAPPFTTAGHVPIDDTMTYALGIEVPPGQSREVEFRMFAAHAGDFAGELDFCIDSEVRCVSFPARTIVRDGGERETPAPAAR